MSRKTSNILRRSNAFEIIKNDVNQETEIDDFKATCNLINLSKIDIKPILDKKLNFKDAKLESQFLQFNPLIKGPIFILLLCVTIFITATLFLYLKEFFSNEELNKDTKDAINLNSISEFQPLTNNLKRMKIADILNKIYFCIGLLICLIIFILLILNRQTSLMIFLIYFMLGDSLNNWELSVYTFDSKEDEDGNYIHSDSKLFKNLFPYSFLTLIVEVLLKTFVIHNTNIKYYFLISSTIISFIKESTLILIVKKYNQLNLIIIIIISRVSFNILLTFYSFKLTKAIKSNWYKTITIFEYFKENKEILDSLKTGILELKPTNNINFLDDIKDEINFKITQNKFIKNNIKVSEKSILKIMKESNINITKHVEDRCEKLNNYPFYVDKCNSYFKSLLNKINEYNLQEKIKESSSNRKLENESISLYEDCKDIKKDYKSHDELELFSEFVCFDYIKLLFSKLEDINEDLPTEIYDSDNKIFHFEIVKDYNFYFKEFLFIGTFSLNSVLNNNYLNNDNKVYDISIMLTPNGSIRIRCDDISRVKSLEISKAKFNYRNKFLSKVSHEFLNPISCIVELTRTNDENDKCSEDSNKSNKNEYLNESFIKNHYHHKSNIKDINKKNTTKMNLIYNLSEYLYLLIKDFYTTAKIDTNNLNLLEFDNSQKIRLSNLMNFLSDIFLSRLAMNPKEIFLKTSLFNINIDSLIEADEFLIDETRIKQILINIVLNSYKFIKAKGNVHINFEIRKEVQDNNLNSLYKHNISMKSKNNNLIATLVNETISNKTYSPPKEKKEKSVKKILSINITDDGPGLKKDIIESLNSESFIMFDNDENSTNLGLVLIKELTFLLGGKLRVECPETGGTVFNLEFYNELSNKSNLKDKKHINSLDSNLILLKNSKSVIELNPLCHENNSKINRFKHSNTQKFIKHKGIFFDDINDTIFLIKSKSKHNNINNSNISNSFLSKTNFNNSIDTIETCKQNYEFVNNLIYDGNDKNKISELNKQNDYLNFEKKFSSSKEVKIQNIEDFIIKKYSQNNKLLDLSMISEKPSFQFINEESTPRKLELKERYTNPHLTDDIFKLKFLSTKDQTSLIIPSSLTNQLELTRLKFFKEIMFCNEGNFEITCPIRKKSSILEMFNFEFDKTLIVVDDEVIIQNSNKKVIASYLKDKGLNYNILTASDGIEALYIYYNCMLKGKPVDIIISDQRMNFMCGSQLANLINKSLFEKRCKFYLLTAYEDLGNEEGAIDKILNKPLNKSKLSVVEFS